MVKNLNGKKYGLWASSEKPLPTLNVGHMNGIQLSCDSKGAPTGVSFQYVSEKGATDFQQIDMDFGNAICALSLLKCLQLDTKTPFPDDPRHPDDAVS